jgi:hypothetical protein
MARRPIPKRLRRQDVQILFTAEERKHPAFERFPKSVPMPLLNEKWAQKNHGQTLKRLNERGGVCMCEALAIIGKRRWFAIESNRAASDLIRAITFYQMGGGK